MTESLKIAPTTTIFERVWRQSGGHIFKSTRHEVMAIADAFPKMPLQVVVAPASGTPGEVTQFYDLELQKQRQLLEVGLAVGSKILNNCTPDQRSMFTLEGFAVNDHAHLVYYAGERGQGIDRYTGAYLGDVAVQHTIETIVFSATETADLESRLDSIK